MKKKPANRFYEILFFCLTNTEDLARVIPTFIRRELERKPISPLSLALTHENIATSFSLPFHREKRIKMTNG